MTVPELFLNLHCAVVLCTAWAAHEQQDFVTIQGFRPTATKPRSSTSKMLIPGIIAFLFCDPSPRLLWIHSRPASWGSSNSRCFWLPIASTKGAGRETGCCNCLKQPCASLKPGQSWRRAKHLSYLQGCHNPESQQYRSKKGVPLICNCQARALYFKEQLETWLDSDLSSSLHQSQKPQETELWLSTGPDHGELGLVGMKSSWANGKSTPPAAQLAPGGAPAQQTSPFP